MSSTVVNLGPSGICMDTSKAMAILGFSPSQTFESTTIQEVNRAFMYKMHILQSNSNKARIKPDKKKAKNFNPRQQLDRRSEMRKLNEALQYLTKKRTKSKAQHDWNFKGKKGIVITSVMNALAPDERRKYMRSEAYRQEMALVLKAKEIESKKAMELAESLTEYMDPVKPNSYKEEKSNKANRKSIRKNNNNIGTHTSALDLISDENNSTTEKILNRIDSVKKRPKSSTESRKHSSNSDSSLSRKNSEKRKESDQGMNEENGAGGQLVYKPSTRQSRKNATANKKFDIPEMRVYKPTAGGTTKPTHTASNENIPDTDLDAPLTNVLLAMKRTQSDEMLDMAGTL